MCCGELVCWCGFKKRPLGGAGRQGHPKSNYFARPPGSQWLIQAINIVTSHCEPEGRGNLVFIGFASSSREARDSSQ